jgi:hypothetical protein
MKVKWLARRNRKIRLKENYKAGTGENNSRVMLRLLTEMNCIIRVIKALSLIFFFFWRYSPNLGLGLPP